MSRTIYTYVKGLVGKPENEKIENWRCIAEWLEKKGYRKPLNKNALNLPIENLDAIVKLVKVNKINSITHNSFSIEVNISFQASLPNNLSEVQAAITETNEIDSETT